MRCAVLDNRVQVLECLHDLRLQYEEGEWTWEPNLMRISLQREDVDFGVLEWLYERLPMETYPLLERDMRLHTQRGSLNVVQWFHGHGRHILQRVVDEAATRNHIHVLRYLYQHTSRRCSCAAVDQAAGKGYLDVVKLVVEHQSLDVVEYLAASEAKLNALHAIDFAAGNGHLELVSYLHERNVGGSTTLAADLAASNATSTL